MIQIREYKLSWVNDEFWIDMPIESAIKNVIVSGNFHFLLVEQNYFCNGRIKRRISRFKSHEDVSLDGMTYLCSLEHINTLYHYYIGGMRDA